MDNKQMEKPLYIHVSKIASILGYNKYVNTEKYVDMFIDYLYKDRYDLLKSDEEIKKDKIYNSNEKFNNLVSNLLSNISNEDKKTINNILKNSSKSTADINRNNIKISKIIKTIEDTKISKTIKNKIKNELSSKINTKYGQYNENVGIVKYQSITGNNVYNSNTQLYVIKQNIEFETLNYFICGKTDGFVDINDECHIFEIKNRKNKIFMEIPIYETIQILLYSYILNIQNVIFVQNFNDQIKIDKIKINLYEDELNEELNNSTTDSDNEDIQRNKINYPSLFKEIINKLNRYIELIYKLRTNDELRLEFIGNTNNKKKLNIINNFINNI
jgi:hypothetical protein